MKNKIVITVCMAIIIVALIYIFLLYKKNIDESNKLGNNTANEIQEVDMDLLKSKNDTIDMSKFDFKSETIINLSNNEIKIDGSGASVKTVGGIQTIEIVNSGAYRVSGTIDNGRIIVNSKNSDINLILDNANITCLSSSPIYIYKSDTTMITLADNSKNTLNDGENYVFEDEYSSSADEEPNSCLYSKSDLILYGRGELTVNANNNNAITSKDTLYIENANISVSAKNNGINGKDSNVIKNSKLNVTAGGDGIRATNDTDETLGWVRIENSEIMINAGEDGIQAETYLIIYRGVFDIIAGEGSSKAMITNNNDFMGNWNSINSITNTSVEEEISRKGIKAAKTLLLEAAEMNIDSYDDAIHTNENIKIVSGTYILKTRDDGIHADYTVTIDNGKVEITDSYEGIEGNNIVINDGSIDITSSDDGINVNGGNDFSGFGNFDRGFNNKGNVTIKSSTNGTEKMDDGIRMNGSSKKGNKEIPSRDLIKQYMQMPPDKLNEVNFEMSGDFMNFGDGENPKKLDIEGSENNISSMEMKDISNMNNASNKNSELENILIINGGMIVVNAAGDGIDSNGKIRMIGGTVIVYGPTNSGNGALDYANTFEISGGTLIAIGASGMAQSTSSSSTQTSIFTNIQSQKGNAKIVLKDTAGNEIVNCVSPKTFSNLVISSEKLVKNETYELSINDEKIVDVIAGQSSSNLGFGGNRGSKRK